MKMTMTIGTGGYMKKIFEKEFPRAFIFDLDGTLIDTEKIYRIIWPQAISELGYEFSDERFLSLRSLGRPFAPAKFREWYGESFDYDKARKIRKGFFDRYIAENGIQLKPGVIELLNFLHKKGIVTAIATATDIARAGEYMEMTGLTGYFDKVISATMVPEGKPSPYVYRYACEQLGFDPSVCVAVEDAPNGIRSAHDAGLKVIMVPDLTEPDENILPMLTLRVDCLSDIIEHF